MDVMSQEIKCYGCGAVIQTDDQKKIGYVPKNALENDQILCQRCFRIKNYGDYQVVTKNNDEYIDILPPFQFFKNKRVGTNHSHCQRKQGTHHREERRPEKCSDIGGIPKYHPVRINIKSFRP